MVEHWFLCLHLSTLVKACAYGRDEKCNVLAECSLLQFLHLQTKFASPREPEISFVSLYQPVSIRGPYFLTRISGETYTFADSDPSWMDLATRSALDLERVIVW